MILYITGRPDMQKQRVVSWLSQHNFPQGMIFFSDGLVHDPLRQKAIFLRNLVQEVSAGPGAGPRPRRQGLEGRPLLVKGGIRPQPSSTLLLRAAHRAWSDGARGRTGGKARLWWITLGALTALRGRFYLH